MLDMLLCCITVLHAPSSSHHLPPLVPYSSVILIPPGCGWPSMADFYNAVYVLSCTFIALCLPPPRLFRSVHYRSRTRLQVGYCTYWGPLRVQRTQKDRYVYLFKSSSCLLHAYCFFYHAYFYVCSVMRLSLFPVPCGSLRRYIYLAVTALIQPCVFSPVPWY